MIDNQFSGTTTAGGALAVLDADGSSVTHNTFNGTAATALVMKQAGDTVSANNTFTSFGSGTDVATVDSFDLRNVTGAENLTLLDGAANTQTFDDMGTGPITDGENGWKFVGSGKDQAVVDLSGNHVFRMSSDPSIGDFSGPFSPALTMAAGESTTSASFRSQSISFDFSAVNAIPDGSRLEIDFGNAAGTDRNNFLVIESFGATGLRIAVSEPDLAGNFSGNDTATAPNDWRELISNVDPTKQHHLEMRLTYVDGPNNDKIDIYLDGVKIGTTTTFENYHDADPDNVYSYPDHASAAADYTTDRVFFRGSANGAPQDGPGGANNGFYVDNLKTAVYNNVNGTGTESANVITGNSRDNTLTGLGGNDTLDGGAGNDILIGGAGNDTLDGGTGDNILLGMGGNDVFVFTNGDGNDTITDFAHGEDHIWFNGANLHSFADVTAHASYNAAANVTTISYEGGTITLNGVALSTLTSGDFIFT